MEVQHCVRSLPPNKLYSSHNWRASNLSFSRAVHYSVASVSLSLLEKTEFIGCTDKIRGVMIAQILLRVLAVAMVIEAGRGM